MAVRHKEFLALEIEVITISVDSVYTHKSWSQTELAKMINREYPFPMLEDQGGSIGKLFGVYDEQQGINSRATFLVDPQGVIQMCEMLSSSVGRNPHELIRLIKAHKLSYETGAAIPSGWNTGEKTLVPLPSLSGEVWQQWKPTI